MPINIYETIYMLSAIEELPLEHTFFKDRYFPTDDMMDVFNTSKVLADYREGNRKGPPSSCRASGACLWDARGSRLMSWNLPISVCPCR